MSYNSYFDEGKEQKGKNFLDRYTTKNFSTPKSDWASQAVPNRFENAVESRITDNSMSVSNVQSAPKTIEGVKGTPGFFETAAGSALLSLGGAALGAGLGSAFSKAGGMAKAASPEAYAVGTGQSIYAA
jgi:hypothetical protein